MNQMHISTFDEVPSFAGQLIMHIMSYGWVAKRQFFFFQQPPAPFPPCLSSPLQPSPSFRLVQVNLGRNAEGREHTERCCQKKILLESIKEDFSKEAKNKKTTLHGHRPVRKPGIYVIEELLIVSSFTKTRNVYPKCIQLKLCCYCYIHNAQTKGELYKSMINKACVQRDVTTPADQFIALKGNTFMIC